jgi:hypothetical protein
MLPFIGRLPVNSQILAIKFLSLKGRTDYRSRAMLQALFPQFTDWAGSVMLEMK